MSSSMFLTIYCSSKSAVEDFPKNVERAKRLFKHVWNDKYTGIDKNGCIKGLAPLFDGSEESAHVDKVLKIDPVDKHNIRNYTSFTFHNGCYRNAYLDAKEEVHMDMIYEVFADIFAKVSDGDYVVKMESNPRNEVLDEGDRVGVFYDEDGTRYCRDLKHKDNSEYYSLLADKLETEESLDKINKKITSHKGEENE